MTIQPDIVIIGSGIGGSTMAAALAPTGAKIVILEAGDHLPDRPENRDQRAIFQRGHFRPKEMWYEADGTALMETLVGDAGHLVAQRGGDRRGVDRRSARSRGNGR